MASVVGIVVAGGSGQRLGAAVPKAFLDIAGRSMLRWSVEVMRGAGVADLVVVVPAGLVTRARREVGGDVILVEGGVTRMASVAAGLATVPRSCRIVAVHDAVRPFMPAESVMEAIDALVQDSDVVAAAPGLPVSDTLKRVEGRVVDSTVDRLGLVAVQTPQVFQRSVLQTAHRRAAVAGQMGTDDLTLVERLVADGDIRGRVVITPGSTLGMKITYPDDLIVGAAIARLGQLEQAS